MPYRTSRAFREQLGLLALAGQLEQARAGAEAAAARGRRRRAAREQRRADQLSQALIAALELPSLRQVAEDDLLPGVRTLLRSGPPATVVHAAAAEQAQSRLPLIVLTAACLAAWTATLVEAGVGGISSRPELIVPDVAALTLTLVAVLVGLRSG